MLDCFTTEVNAHVIEITPITKNSLGDWLNSQTDQLAGWVKKTGFSADPGKSLILPPNKNGDPSGLLLGTKGKRDFWSWGEAAEKLSRCIHSWGQRG